MSSSLKQRTIAGIIWSTIERFSIQGVSFVVMVFMARMLSPNDYGLIGALTVFIAVSQSLIDSGFSQALIREQNRTDIDNSTVFYFNVGVGIFLYVVLFACAPFIADFYEKPQLVSITRIIGLSIVFNSLTVVQRALLTIAIDFKVQAKASFVAAVIAGIIGIYLAYHKFGVWAIVTQQLVNNGINTILLWTFSRWTPKLAYSWKSFCELFSFGSRLLLSGLLETLYKNVYLIIIGKIFNTSDLGYYTRAQQFAEFPSSNITGIMQRVTYPILCSIQDDDVRLASVYRKFLRISAFVVFPLMTGLAAVAKPTILFFLKEQWLFTATILQVLCFSMMWYPIHAINLNLLQVKGRSDLFLKLEILKKIVGVVILCVTIPLGLIAMCVGGIVSSMVGLVINTYYSGKLINVGYLRQMRDVMPTFVLSLVSGTIVYITVNNLCLSPLLLLIIGIIVGFIIYVATAYFLHFSEIDEIKEIIKKNQTNNM